MCFIFEVQSDLHSCRMNALLGGKVHVDKAKFPRLDLRPLTSRIRRRPFVAGKDQISRSPIKFVEGVHRAVSIFRFPFRNISFVRGQEVDTDLLTFLRGLAFPACFWCWDIRATTKPAWHGDVRCQARLSPPFRQRLAYNGIQSMHTRRRAAHH